MIKLSMVQYLPFTFWNEEIKTYKSHKSGFGTEITDINGGKHHVKETVEEIKDKLNNSCDGYVNLSELDRDSKNVSLGKTVPPRTIQIELPKNVPSKVKPIVIFPLVGLDEISVKVNQHKGIFGGTTFEGLLSPNQSHVINLNTGVE